MTDEINHPSHYMLFPDMQAIDVIEAVLSPAEFAGYLKGNALKYRLRAGEKGPAEICLGKAEWYQDRLFQHYDGMGWSEDLKAMEEKDFGQQNTIDCRTDEQKGFNDPRTVEGVDVSFPTEKHMNFAPDEKCDCHRCIADQGLSVGGLPLNMLKMILCPICGNKRCPKANDHRNECTGSNEPGQEGSAYR